MGSKSVEILFKSYSRRRLKRHSYKTDKADVRERGLYLQSSVFLILNLELHRLTHPVKKVIDQVEPVPIKCLLPASSSFSAERE